MFEQETLLPFWLEAFAVVFVGLSLGSFTTAIIYRIPKGLPWAFQSKNKEAAEVSAYRSICPSCENTLKSLDLVPVFSWLFLKGKCRHCKTPIPLRYPAVELGVVLSLFLAYLVHGISPELLFIAISLPLLWGLLVIDLDHLILPNQLVAILGVTGAIRLLYFWGYEGSISDFEAVEFVAGAVIFAFFIWFLGWIMTKILKKESLGFGDVKFFGVAGLWLGIQALAMFALISGVAGIVFALIWRWKTKNEVFPFGPALIFSFYVLLLIDGSQFF